MSYGVREYGVREYGDGMRVITTAVGGGGGTNPIAGTDTLTFSESATLSTSLRANDTLTFTDTATVLGSVLMSSDAGNPEFAVRFRETARLSVIVPPVTPPDGTVYIKRVSHTMPAPTLDANGRPT